MVTTPSQHARTEAPVLRQPWNYTLDVLPGAEYTVTATAYQASILLPYTANLTLYLGTGALLTVPIKGTFNGTTLSSPVGIAGAPECSLCTW